MEEIQRPLSSFPESKKEEAEEGEERRKRGRRRRRRGRESLVICQLSLNIKGKIIGARMLTNRKENYRYGEEDN